MRKLEKRSYGALFFLWTLSNALGDTCAVPVFEAPRVLEIGSEPRFVLSADFNRDGKQDLLVVGGSYTGAFPKYSVSLLLAKTDGTFDTTGRYDLDQDPSVALEFSK
jgi:hypothetical protein